MGHLMLHCFYRCQMTFPTGPLQMYCTALFCISQKNTMIYMCVDGTACTSAFLSRLAGAAWSDVTQTHKQMYTHMMIHTCCWDCMYISLLTLSCWSCMEWCHTDTQTDGCTSAFLPCLAGVAWSDVTQTHKQMYTQTHKQMYTHWMIHRWVAGTGCTSAFLPCLAGVAWSNVTCWVEFWCSSSFDVGQMTESFCWFCLKRVSAKKERNVIPAMMLTKLVCG